MVKYQNKISHLFLGGSDLANREKDVLEDASERLQFKPEKLLDRSSWWSSKEIGAFRYIGSFKGKKAVLKIQGVRPVTSEIYMIFEFSKRNKSKIMRPPLLYSYLSWDDQKEYEALVLEFIDGEPIVNSPTSKQELDEFFRLRDEYKKNCAQDSWIGKPKEFLSEEVRNNFVKWRQASFKLYPQHPLRKDSDIKLIDDAVAILTAQYLNTQREFQHGHFGVNDLLKNKKGEVIILSNLYWSWKPPFYDAVFGYNWFIYHLADVNNSRPHPKGVKLNIKDFIEQEKNMWFAKINSLTKTAEEKKLLNLALLERAAAGLNLDALSLGQSMTAEFLVQSIREEINRLISLIKQS